MDLSFYKNIKYPLCFLYNINNYVNKNKNKISDEMFFYTIKYFLRFFHPKLISYNILPLFKDNKDTHNKTFILVKSHQELLKLNIINFTELLKYKNRVLKNIIKMKLEKQIQYWKNKLQKLEAINDSSFGEGFFLKIIQNDKNESYQNELLNRIILIKKLFGCSFFFKNKISLFTVESFYSFDNQIKNKIFLKLIIKLRNILKNDIELLTKTLNSWNLIKYIYS